MLIKFLNGSSREVEPLYGANLSYAHLYGANLSSAHLCGANLSYANLCGANLCGANLYGANLRYANLDGANLSSANLRYANLSYANLSYASLRYANLSYAHLYGANLSYANLDGANLRYANLRDAKGLEQFCILPAGDLIGWKKCRDGIVQLRIPADAQRINAYGSRKCRAEYAIVVAQPNGKPTVGNYDEKTAYVGGQIVRPDKYDPDPRIDCSHGIHFFITRAEAEEYCP